MNVLFKRKNTAVTLYAHFEPPNSACPISHTSRTEHGGRGGEERRGFKGRYNVLSGCFMQYLHSTSDVYRTHIATTSVKIMPGTSPKTEKDQGKLCHRIPHCTEHA